MDSSYVIGYNFGMETKNRGAIVLLSVKKVSPCTDVPSDSPISPNFASIYLSGLVTAVAVFRNPNTIPFSLATDLLTFYIPVKIGKIFWITK